MDIDWGTWLYAAACVVVPALWGGVAAWIFGRIDRKRLAKSGTRREEAYVDYSI